MSQNNKRVITAIQQFSDDPSYPQQQTQQQKPGNSSSKKKNTSDIKNRHKPSKSLSNRQILNTLDLDSDEDRDIDKQVATLEISSQLKARSNKIIKINNEDQQEDLKHQKAKLKELLKNAKDQAVNDANSQREANANFRYERQSTNQKLANNEEEKYAQSSLRHSDIASSGRIQIQGEEEYWKLQYEEAQKDYKQLKIDYRVLEVKYQRLEEKCQKLEQKQEQGDAGKLLQQLKEKEQIVNELEIVNKELRNEQMQLKVNIQTAQCELQTQESQINQFVNLKVSNEEQKAEFNKLQKKYADEKDKNDQLIQRVDQLQRDLTSIHQDYQEKQKLQQIPHGYSAQSPMMGPSQDQHSQLQIDQLRQDLERERAKSRQYDQERQNLMKQIKDKQQDNIDKKKHKLELEARLKTAEMEAQKSQDERMELEKQIRELKKSQNELMSKIRESQEFLEVCTTFLQKNGLLATSFISDDPF